jgi:hypothetical protein
MRTVHGARPAMHLIFYSVLGYLPVQQIGHFRALLDEEREVVWVDVAWTPHGMSCCVTVVHRSQDPRVRLVRRGHGGKVY